MEAVCPCSVASCQGRHRLVLAPSERQDPSVPDSKNRTDPPVLALAVLGPLGKLGRPHTGRTPRCVRTAADHALAVAVAAESEVCADGVVASDSAVVVICVAAQGCACCCCFVLRCLLLLWVSICAAALGCEFSCCSRL